MSRPRHSTVYRIVGENGVYLYTCSCRPEVMRVFDLLRRLEIPCSVVIELASTDDNAIAEDLSVGSLNL